VERLPPAPCGFQDTSMLEGDLKRLSMFYDLGVRIAQPTYNRRIEKILGHNFTRLFTEVWKS